MRALTYWLASVFIAVMAAKAAERADDWGAFSADPLQPLLSIPDGDRSVLLGVGVLAMAYTYRKAWLDWRRRA